MISTVNNVYNLCCATLGYQVHDGFYRRLSPGSTEQQSKARYRLHAFLRINPALLRRHGVVHPSDIRTAERYAHEFVVPGEDASHQHILHVEAEPEYGDVHPFLQGLQLERIGNGGKGEPPAVRSLARNERDERGEAVRSDIGEELDGVEPVEQLLRPGV